jgi:LuxR family maltose regulon positive regulatory protein
MRARGELAELRVGELQFTGEEAAELLNGSMGLDLAAEEVARLAERTEGWAAGLVLAGLSLRGRPDPGGFIAAFSGGDRHVADYLVAEVLGRQPEELRGFLLRTSVLERLSGRWMTAAAGTATTSCSPTCCGSSLAPASLGWCRCCIGGPRPGTRRTATSTRPSGMPARPGTWPRRAR